MTIPKYVQEILSRSKYEFDYCTKNPNYGAGYTIRIQKASPYTYAVTFKAEIERLCKWCNRVAGVETAHILYMPEKTGHCRQFAVITIFDPIMQKIEQHITKEA